MSADTEIEAPRLSLGAFMYIVLPTAQNHIFLKSGIALRVGGDCEGVSRKDLSIYTKQLVNRGAVGKGPNSAPRVSNSYCFNSDLPPSSELEGGFQPIPTPVFLSTILITCTWKTLAPVVPQGLSKRVRTPRKLPRGHVRSLASAEKKNQGSMRPPEE